MKNKYFYQKTFWKKFITNIFVFSLPLFLFLTIQTGLMASMFQRGPQQAMADQFLDNGDGTGAYYGDDGTYYGNFAIPAATSNGDYGNATPIYDQGSATPIYDQGSATPIYSSDLTAYPSSATSYSAPATWEGAGCNGMNSVWGTWKADGSGLINSEADYGAISGQCGVGASAPVYNAPAQATWEGAGCNGNQSVWGTWTADGSRLLNTEANYGVKTGECGNSYPAPTYNMTPTTTSSGNNNTTYYPYGYYAPYTYTDNSRYTSTSTTKVDSHNTADSHDIVGSYNDDHSLDNSFNRSGFNTTTSISDSRDMSYYPSYTNSFNPTTPVTVSPQANSPVIVSPTYTSTSPTVSTEQPTTRSSGGLLQSNRGRTNTTSQPIVYTTAPSQDITYTTVPTAAYHVVTSQSDSGSTCPIDTTVGQDANGQTICIVNSDPAANEAKNIVTQSEPKVVAATDSNTDQLPKTGAPLALAGLGGLLPFVKKLKRNHGGLVTSTTDNANFLWEQRQLSK